MINNLRQLIIVLGFCTLNPVFAQKQNTAQLFSTAGFYPMENSGRSVFNFNNNWYFHKGDLKDGAKVTFNKAQWSLVQLPHNPDVLSDHASGGANYQGIIWYRKFFKIPKDLKSKQIHLHFEAIMGKCEIYINGKLVQKHKGGYLPILVPLQSDQLLKEENTISIKADNSDDGSYPPGKAQYVLDFSYFGGIYRDVWLVANNDIHVTDPMQTNKIAGGGVFIHSENVNENSAQVVVSTHIQRAKISNESLYLETYLKDAEGNTVVHKKTDFNWTEETSVTLQQTLEVSNPKLWSPEQPNLYQVYTVIKNKAGQTFDGFFNKIGIRSIEFKGKEGLYLNGKPYQDKLIGANHHQDYAYIGNAVPNNLQWREVKKMKDAGIKLIRLAHYPHDPAFMDACDELGVFVIIPTPGWQYWPNNETFTNLVIENNRLMVRRDRNHPSVIAWEPILNETNYTEAFAKKAYQSIHEEYPYDGCVAATDINTPGWEQFDLIYAHPNEENAKHTSKSIYTREWGDNVDDWNTHNSTSRVARGWGEVPQLIQSTHYSNPSFKFDCIDMFYATDRQHVGGALWHSFDHQRGYHPDPFYGGLMDVFRQPKYSYFMFQSQQDPAYLKNRKQEPYSVYIANEMTPFSPTDVTIYTNCDAVRLIVMDKDTLYQTVDRNKFSMPHPPILFKNVYQFMQLKKLARSNKPEMMKIVAEGLVNGKVVATATKKPARRPVKIILTADMDGLEPMADGSSIIPIIASVTDEQGVVKRLNEESIKFTILGEGELIGNVETGANPRKIDWGTASALIRTTNTAGKITIVASPVFEGANSVLPDTLVIETKTSSLLSIYEKDKIGKLQNKETNVRTNKVDRKLLKQKLQEVEVDQEAFENKGKKKNQ